MCSHLTSSHSRSSLFLPMSISFLLSWGPGDGSVVPTSTPSRGWFNGFFHSGNHRTVPWFLTPQKTEERILELLDMVELNEESLDRYPHQFSGGQKQRIGIARAIALKPALLICDESVSALDVCVQAQILNLLKKLKKQLGLTCLFISHDLSVVSFIADRVCVMKDGSICELAPADRLYAAPEHEYTKYLLASIPRPECHSPSYNPAKP
ncbi:MAG: ABC transporter ATP-binding protein [Lachnospiraceae bacterium]|nr:ABC transporter ATP-binding protein [Lachnospiraceae bacterium]